MHQRQHVAHPSGHLSGGEGLAPKQGAHHASEAGALPGALVGLQLPLQRLLRPRQGAVTTAEIASQVPPHGTEAEDTAELPPWVVELLQPAPRPLDLPQAFIGFEPEQVVRGGRNPAEREEHRNAELLRRRHVGFQLRFAVFDAHEGSHREQFGPLQPLFRGARCTLRASGHTSAVSESAPFEVGVARGPQSPMPRSLGSSDWANS